MSETTRTENLRTCWKPRQSRNPKGRPRGSCNRVIFVALAAMRRVSRAM